uniref:Uncharacterized protein n=1 Tax=Ciona savignyi TaxID=51511 RepID=H2Z1Q5_CIOSA
MLLPEAVLNNLGVSVLIGLVTFCMLLYQYWWKFPHPCYPPGVRGVPVLGALPFFGKFAHKTILQWSREKYGKIMSVRMGPNDAVVLNDYDTIIEAFVKQHLVFSSRPPIRMIREFSGDFGLGFCPGNKKFFEVRNFTSKVLRGFGMGRIEMEIRVSDVAQDLVQVFESLNGKATNIRMTVGAMVCNVISSVVLGKTYDINDENMKEIVHCIFNTFGDKKNSKYVMILTFFYAMRHIPPFKKARKMFLSNITKQLDFGQKEIDEHKKNLDENSPGDFIDAFLIEMKKHSPTDSWFHEKQLLLSVNALFIAGTETTTSTILWAMIVLLNYPNLQYILHKELMTETGEVNPSVKHGDNLPLLQAFIQELYRCITIAPLGLQRTNTEDVEIGGHFIPKNTVILPNIYAVHNDPVIWTEPSKFDIYRHIDKDGKFIHSKKVIPFGVGARVCLGKKLAQLEVFIFLANIIKKFEIIPDPKTNEIPPIHDGLSGAGFFPYPFKVIVKSRRG